MGTRTRSDGWTLNGYATLVRNDLFAAITLGGDQLRAKLTAPELAGYTPQTAQVGSFGASFEAGVRKPFLFGSMLEPSLGVAYVRSSIGELGAAGAQFHFDDSESLRLSFGARLTGAVGGLSAGAWSTRYEASLRAVDDLDAATTVNLASDGPNLRLVDNFQKQFGEARIGLITRGSGGWSGSVNLQERFSGASTDTGLVLVLRDQF
jgi:hypothetical protein